VIYGNSWRGQVDNRNQGKPSPGAMPSLGGVGDSIALPRGKEGILYHERDRDGPVRVELRRSAAQVCMNVIQQFVLLLVKLNN
jgi:hypothetical protein